MAGPDTYLDAILAAHRARAAEDARPIRELVDAATALPATRGFARALTPVGLSVIAEIKRRSPSKGALAPDGLDPALLAKSYEAGGASCLSVLTDGPHFGGSADDLARARASVDLPVLRKDFTVGERDVCDARLMGADAVLLIAAALDAGELARFHALARQVGLDALVEVHDEGELAAALAAGATLIGVNQRDLVTFEVDHERALRMADAIPDGIVKVAESGVRSASEARRLEDAGFDAVLVGEHLVTSLDPSPAIRELRGV
jgi:indole-3-glycerol phosphate synthase